MRIGFIGMGNMAEALVTGFIRNGGVKGEEIYAFAPNQEKLKEKAERIGFRAIPSLDKLVECSDAIILACKPYQVAGVLAEIKDELKDKVVISIALGWNFKKWQDEGIEKARFQFVMPNTPAITGEGVFLFEEENSLDYEERKGIKTLFEKSGLVVELSSELMGIGGAISGCGPAFVDMFIEAYADVAVKYGIPRETAYKLVSMMVMGSAKLQLMTGEHPAVLKDKVCSPSGSTIKGVTALEREGMRKACQASIDEIMVNSSHS